jgi:hypothetical protein
MILPYPQLGKQQFQHHMSTVLNGIDGVTHEYISFSLETKGRYRHFQQSDVLLQIRATKRLQEPTSTVHEDMAQLEIILSDHKQDRSGNGLYIAHSSGASDILIIIDHVYNYFKQLAFYLERSSYLNLLEGSGDTIDRSNPAERYLLDLLVCKEICSYLPECAWDENSLFQGFGDPF